MKTRVLVVALLVLVASCTLVLPAISSQEQEGFVIVGADAVATRETGMSLTLPIPVEPRFVLERADRLIRRETQSIPEGMPTLLEPRFVLERADAIRQLHLAYPCELVGEPDDPVISNLQVTDIQASQATVAWSTNEYTDGLLEYGLAPGTFSENVYDPEYVTLHTYTLSALLPDTVYYCRVTSTDRCGNTASTTSGCQFTTTTTYYIYLPLAVRSN